MAETRGTPRPRRALTEQEILDAALALLDAGGAEAASIRRIAVAVGSAPTAVYTYFPDRAAVEHALIEYVLAEVAADECEVTADEREVATDECEVATDEREVTAQKRPDDWRERVEVLTADLRRQLLAHPGVIPLMLAGPMTGPHALRLGEHLLDLLAAGGLDPASAARGSYLLMVYVLGATSLEVADAPPGLLAPEAERIAALRAALSDVPAQAFPRTAAAVGVTATWTGAEQFRWGLRRLLDGLAAEAELD
ncbi:TetR/AcrR family transcriptional regulator C-terminal domain-containing protein [Actinoplanes sp. KI2]|uniref:TetR/AcrR family transcriptional regulator C-terminal domain-containing protein n=1 Tax=Actinoplanes sp. KI2 TaxID=2983315 RepID=UPI0021D571C0|nr:TetR/AcrR family transcriptional regulator C-terminal domain-containing protein [Actinoplanes sp. KI2]MCU7728648.1 TetR/AcrR family transcriptional regulator C-terminal domain-containing protein [Actinoplanes sp. KI2]